MTGKILLDNLLVETPKWHILVDDNPLDKKIGVTGITVVHQINELAFSEIRFGVVHDWPFFSDFNKKIEIQAGHNQDYRTIFSGQIVSIRNVCFTDGSVFLIIRGEDTLSGPIHTKTNASPILKLQYGATILELDIEMNKDGKTKGMVSVMGMCGPFLGENLKLSGLSEGFNKVFQIIGVEHNINDQEWRTILTIKNNK